MKTQVGIQVKCGKTGERKEEGFETLCSLHPKLLGPQTDGARTGVEGTCILPETVTDVQIGFRLRLE